MNPVKDKLNIEMNFSNAGDHVPEADWNIRMIKERIRATFHRLPYKAIPCIRVQYLVMDWTHKITCCQPRVAYHITIVQESYLDSGP